MEIHEFFACHILPYCTGCRSRMNSFLAQSMSTSGAIGPNFFLFLAIVGMIFFGSIGSTFLFLSFKFIAQKATRWFLYIPLFIFGVVPGGYGLVELLLEGNFRWSLITMAIILFYIAALTAYYKLFQ
jgi:hypothetical protein